ncbi:CPBP family intramembrane glutamic endopeptidase [Mammaliicoccus sciuri]|uniref:CPBP family intramembrane glutamic endopeptidase n=1 Tax=Mammaliicoccus sciuri TaxID=1296 RepID=UPI00374F1E4C
MRQYGVVKSLILSIISIALIFTIYWLDSSKNVWHIGVMAALSVLIYYVNTKAYQQAEVSLTNGRTYRRLKSYKVKKQYIFWIICSAILFEAMISGIFNLPKDTANEHRIDSAIKGMTVTDSIINIGVLSPIIEEIIFRGLFYMVCSGIVILVFNRFFKNATKKHIDKTTGITFVVISSIVFGMLHVIRAGDFENLAPYVLSGIIYSVLYLTTKTIYIPLLLHMLGNTISTFGSIYQAGLIGIDVAYEIAILVILYFLIGLIVWGILHNKAFNELSMRMQNEARDLGLNKKTAAKRHILELTRYVKEQMTMK